MLTQLIVLVRKDLELFLSDRRALILSFVAPIVIASFFGFIFSGASAHKAPAKIDVALSDLDGSSISTRIVSATQADSKLNVVMMDESAAREAVRKGSIVVAAVIPKGFGDAASRAFFTGRQRPELTLLYDPSHNAELALLHGVLTQHVIQSVSKEVFSGESAPRVLDETLRDLDASGMQPAQRERVRAVLLAAQALYSNDETSASSSNLEIGVPFNMTETAVTSSTGVSYNGYAHAFAGLGMQFVLIAGVDLGIAVLLERQRGLWRRLRSAPISRHLLLTSKVISGTLIGSLSLLVCFAFAIAVFDVRIHGSALGFVLVSLASALMAASFGLLIAALGNTTGATRGVSMLAVLIMVMLSGAWIPMFLFPAWLQGVTKIIPVRWAIDGLEAMTWRGLDLSNALIACGVLFAFSAAFFVATLTRFRWEE
ncbi:MAG TPA: ABC transporter permease [Steroidobacteraceae bacterium]|nr:ABC transporter permease [Steroidobacteraceae bacterium]